MLKFWHKKRTQSHSVHTINISIFIYKTLKKYHPHFPFLSVFDYLFDYLGYFFDYLLGPGMKKARKIGR